MMHDYFNTDDLRIDLKKHAIQSGGITLFAHILFFFIQTISTIILARILVPEDFGIFAMVTAIGGFLVIFADMGLTDATIQKADLNHNQVSNLFWLNLAATTSVVVVVIALSPLISWFYSEPRLMLITTVWSTYLILSAVSTQHIALLKRRMLFFQVSMNEIAAALISNVLAIILALKSFGYWTLVYRQISYSLIFTCGAWILCKWRPGLPVRNTEVHSMLIFGRNATGYFLTDYFTRNLDKILVGWRFGALNLGYYHKAYYLFILPATQLTTSLKNVATATLSKLRNEPSKFCNYYLNAISYISFISMPISFFFFIESEDIVLLILGHQWTGSVEIFRILSVGAGVWVIYSTTYWLHAALGRTERLMQWGIISLLLSSIAISFGLLFGTEGVAAAYIAVLYTLSGPGLSYAGKPVGLKFASIFSIGCKFCFSAIVAGLICWYIASAYFSDYTRLTRIIVLFVLYVSLYLVFVIVFHRSIYPITNFSAVVKELLPAQLKWRF